LDLAVFKDLTIIIVNYRLKIDTEECVRSFLQSGASLDQIIVVDNGSKDDSVSYLTQRFGGDLTIVEAEQALGYANGLNLGLQAGLPCGTRWFLLMNNDTLVEPDFLQEMYAATLQAPEVDLFSPLILYYDDPQSIWFFGSDFLVRGTMITRNTYRDKHQQDFPDITAMDMVNGCAMLVSRSVIEKIGLFETAFYMYGEDGDFCWRAYLSGYKSAGVSKARMFHKVSKIMRNDRPQTQYLRIRNQIWIYRRYSSLLNRLMMFAYSAVRSLLILLRALFRRNFSVLFPILRGWYDGWFMKQQMNVRKPRRSHSKNVVRL
jgi:GT2 family glycosyltransferase